MRHRLADRFQPSRDSSPRDLLTGEIPADGAPGAGAPSLVDVATLAPVREVLDEARDGSPRRLVIHVPRASVPDVVHAAAREAHARGFVPIGASLYLGLGSGDTLGDALRDRALLFVHTGPPGPRGWAALMHAAARSPRPHVLLEIRTGESGSPGIVREARAVYAPGRAPAPVFDACTEAHLRRASRASAFVREGRHAAAERLLRDVSGALARRAVWDAVAGLQVDLGRLLLDRGRASDADRAFEDAAAAAARRGEGARLAQARLWQASARLEWGRLADAESLCRAVLAADRLDPASLALARATLARVLLCQRRVQEAATLDVRVEAHAELEAAGRVYVESVSARTLIAAGRLFEAGVRVQEVLALAHGAGARVTAAALTAHLRVLAAAGDLAGAERRLGEVLAASREARTPLRGVRARLVWIEALIRARRTGEARRALGRLQRLGARATPLLRRAVTDLRSICDRADDRTAAPAVRVSVDSSLAARLVAMAHDEARDADAVQRVVEAVAGTVQSSRVDVVSVDAGPVSTIMSVGAGLPTHLGGRVLDAGIALGPERVEHGHELGVPARLGTRLVAALVARWPADRLPPPGAQALLELASAVASPRLEAMLASSRAAAAVAAAVPELVGVSAAIEDVRAAIERAAPAPFAVLIQGESGVGKELVARAIHQRGPRRERRFCDINCAALPDELLESELFGHTRGAFTGAVADRAGLFEDADGGTLFLDELADLSPRAQAKLLRVVQQQEVRRVGESYGRPVDVRLVAAANRDLALEAESGRFRQDLLYRLDVIRIRIPPLRERPEDVPVLAQHFWEATAPRVGTAATLSHGVLASLSRHHWPGNVRELQNVMAALAVAAPARGLVRAALLPPAIAGATPVTSTRLADARAEFERRVVESALARAAGSRTNAARELGLTRQGLLKIMTRLRLR